MNRRSFLKALALAPLAAPIAMESMALALESEDQMSRSLLEPLPLSPLSRIKTFSDGEILTAKDLNDNFEALKQIYLSGGARLR